MHTGAGRHRRLRTATVVALLACSVAPVWQQAPVAAAPPDVVISEFMAANGGILLDEDGVASDWIEVWNRSAEPVDLAGWHLTDNASNLAKWTFPQIVVPAGGYLVVFASEAARPLHASFKLSAGGEYLGLTDPASTIVSQYAPTFPAQSTNVSYGIGANSTLGFLLTATPGGPNDVAGAGVTAQPVLSRSGGWIDGPVQVTATTGTPGAAMYYTLDGSTPSAGNGTAYTGPITVPGSATLRVAAVAPGWFASKVATATFLAMDEVLDQSGVPPGWPAGPVNDQVMDYGFDPDVVAADPGAVADALRAAPTLSVVTDQANLTDPATGLYTHPLESGSAWERPVSVELFDGTGSFQLDAGLRVKGGISRQPSNPKHSFRLTFAAQYEGPLHAAVLGDGIDTFGVLDLRTEQNYSWHLGSERNTFLRDVWTRDTQAAAGEPATRSRWVHLFLNGQYWGLYMLADRVDDEYAAEQWGGSPGDYDVIQHGDDYDYEVDDGDDTEWLQLWAAIADGAVSDGEMAALAEQVDLANLADFMLVQMVSGNYDSTPNFFAGNLRASNWFAVGGDDQPFRFFVHDAEHTLGALDHDPLGDRTGPFPAAAANPRWSAGNMNPGWLHTVLLGRAEYRVIVRQRAQVLLADDGPLGTAASTARWVARRDVVDALVDAEAARWGDAGGGDFGRDDWAAEVAWVEADWFPVRTAVVRGQLMADGLWVSAIGVADTGYQPATRLGNRS